jgi:hypothetical protein
MTTQSSRVTPCRHALRNKISKGFKQISNGFKRTCCRLSLDHSCCHTAEETCCTLPPAASAAAAAAANSGACLNDRLTLKPARTNSSGTCSSSGIAAVFNLLAAAALKTAAKTAAAANRAACLSDRLTLKPAGR